MGGRGSSGGAGMAKGGSSALSEKMPKLSGSQKQVSWAETIRHDALANADHLVKETRSEFGLGMPSGGYISTKSAELVRKDIVNVFKQVSSASAIIDRRFSFSNRAIKEAMIDAEMKIRRKKK